MSDVSTPANKLIRRLPLSILIVLALSYEPIRSGFVLANQSCELLTDWERVQGAIFNRRHVIAYGLLCLAAAATFRENRILKAAIFIFLFSVFLEFEQSFFITGHCRSWDLIPNILGIGIASAIFLIGVRVL
ncbi:MAG: VanZ family protein, partial [Rhizobiaceae bacterium]